MNNPEILYLSDRESWRNWLERNFKTQKEIWLVYSKKSSGKPRISYNDAVEEALCFGWIDSTIRSMDADYYIQRFTPRNPKSSFSQSNKERLKWLAGQGMLHPVIEERIRHLLTEKFVFPADIMNALKKDKTVWANYKKFSGSYKRIRIAYIDEARIRPEEYRKRLSNFIEKTRQNKLIGGFGGIEKHY